MTATGSPRARIASYMRRRKSIISRSQATAVNQPAEMRTLRRRLVDMERLRIETGGERLDVVGGEGVAADLENVADADVLEIFHGRASGSRRPNIAVVTMVVRQLPASSSTS